jgi:hypothetical protein
VFSCKTDIKVKVTNIVEENNDDLERLKLLDIVFTRGINVLSREHLERLHDLIEKKDYSHDKKAQKSKAKLLKKIGNAIYDHDVKNDSSFKMS